MKRVLVTGGAGFIGRHTLPALTARGYEVHATHRQPIDPVLQAAATWHSVDLLDRGAVSRLVSEILPSHLLHLAWITEHGAYWQSPENLKWVSGSLALVEAFVSHGGQRFVGAGTCAEYDWRYGYCSEAVTPTKPATLYGICKNAVHEITAALAQASTLSLAWGRVFFLFGPYEGQRRLVPSVIHALIEGDIARCSHGRQIRDFLYVTDVASAFAALLDSNLRGAMNIGSGRPLTIAELTLQIARQLGKEELLSLGAIPAPLNDPPMLLAETVRLREELGWMPDYDIESGLSNTIRWWRDQREVQKQGKL